MTKALNQFLLLCALLLAGHGQLAAFSQKAFVPHASEPQVSGTTTFTFSALQGEVTPLAFPVFKSTEQQEYHLDIPWFENEENDEWISLKKYLSNCCTSFLLFPQTLGCFSTSGKKFSPFQKDFSYTSSCRYLILKVFRI